MSKSVMVLAMLLWTTLVMHAQGTSINSFTYQGRLNDASGPANGLFDFQFSLHSASAGPNNQVDTTITRLFMPVTNGLFTVPLSFPQATADFNGTDRWLEISVRPGGAPTNYTILSPRQQITSAPYAIRAGSASSAAIAQSVTGPVAASQISGTISMANLPPNVGNAAPLPAGGIVMSDDPNNSALTAQGYSRMPNAEISLSLEAWVQKNPPADRTEFISTNSPYSHSQAEAPKIVASVSTGTELIVFRSYVFEPNVGVQDEILIFNGATHQWRRAMYLPFETLAPGCTAVWTGTQVILWGGAHGTIDENLGGLRGDGLQLPGQGLHLYAGFQSMVGIGRQRCNPTRAFRPYRGLDGHANAGLGWNLHRIPAQRLWHRRNEALRDQRRGVQSGYRAMDQHEHGGRAVTALWLRHDLDREPDDHSRRKHQQQLV